MKTWVLKEKISKAQKGHWYMALAYLKAENLDKCREQLQLIINNQYYNYQLATDLLSEL